MLGMLQMPIHTHTTVQNGKQKYVFSQNTVVQNSNLYEVLQPASVGAVCVLLRVCEQKQGYSAVCNATNTKREHRLIVCSTSEAFHCCRSFSTSIVNCKNIRFF